VNDIMALDIETGNYSYEIGGWDKTAMFEPTVVATWDGDNGNVYCNKALTIDATVKELHPRTLGEDLAQHIEKGGKILGHNIRGFDLPVLRDALDCWTAGDLLGKADSVIDTHNLVKKAVAIVEGLSCDTTLNTLVKATLDDSKIMNSADAPKYWREGRYDEVAKYCLSDAQLTYDLYKHAQDEGFVKSRCLKTGKVVEIEIEW